MACSIRAPFRDRRSRAIGCRADLLPRRGFYPPPPGASELLGLECAGEAAEVAPGVAGFRVGDRVMALLAGGGYAEEVVGAGSAMPVPESLDLVHPRSSPKAFLTVYLNVFGLGALPEGGWALVHGGGSGIGSAAIQLVRSAGRHVVVTAGSDEPPRRDSSSARLGSSGRDHPPLR